MDRVMSRLLLIGCVRYEDKGGVEGDVHISGLNNRVDGGVNY